MSKLQKALKFFKQNKRRRRGKICFIYLGVNKDKDSQKSELKSDIKAEKQGNKQWSKQRHIYMNLQNGTEIRIYTD